LDLVKVVVVWRTLRVEQGVSMKEQAEPCLTSKGWIYREIRRSIIMGRRNPGERLDLEELSTSFGTSITPVRDALQMLSQEGLVTIKPRSGYFVVHVTLKQLRDLLEFREILELASVERAAARITEDQLRELEQVHAGYAGDDDESYERYMDENRHFHCLIAKAAGNQELAEALGHLHDRLVRFMVLIQVADTLEPRHARIIEVLRSHDVAAARQRMLDEVNETHDAILERVIEEDGAFWRLGEGAR
jgi:DNA-binding GntR family transcriptional regulator